MNLSAPNVPVTVPVTVPVVAFFNNKGGVGKTSLVYHLAWMFADLGLSTVAADLDPQANLTSACLSEERLEFLVNDHKDTLTIYDGFWPLKEGIGDIKPLEVEELAPRLGLLPGDLRLSELEDEFSGNWIKTLDDDGRAFRVISGFWRLMQAGAQSRGASLILMDLGPNLGALNRAALISADAVIIPLAPDLFSLQGLKNLGPTLRKWRAGWKQRLELKGARDISLPAGQMQPVGYIVMQHSVRLDRPVKAYEKWLRRIPNTYCEFVMDEPCAQGTDIPLSSDPNLIFQIKHYRSLMPLAQEANKPMFHLKPGDGALGAHYVAVQDVRADFEKLAREIAERVSVVIPKT